MNVHPPLGINLGMMSHALLGGGSIPSWVVNPTNPPDLAVDFSNNRAWTKATKAQTTSASLLTVSRASSGTVNNSLGNWTSVASNLPRLSDLGLLVEEARTNAIRNNSMAGAVVMADGVELTTNGNFIGGLSGWQVATAGGGSVTWNSNGSITFVGDGVLASHNAISQQISGLVIGRNYVVSISSSVGSTLGIAVGNSAFDTSLVNNAGIFPNGFGSATSDRVAFTATATSHWVTLGRGIASAGTINGSISVQDGERVENGGFTSNPLNASQNTVQNGWQWSISAGTSTATYTGGNSVTLTSDASNDAARIDTSFPTVSGFTYTLTLDATTGGSNLLVGTTQGGAGLLSAASGVGTGLKFQFTATSATTWLRIQRAATGSSVIANVSVQSAGALPTNWSYAGANTSGLIATVQATGIQSGINTIDVNWAGTTTNGNFNFVFDNTSAITSTYGQTWSNSVFLALVGGSLTNVTGVNVYAIDVGGGGGIGTGNVVTPTATLTRYSQSGTITNSANTNVRPQINPVFSGTGVAVNFTLRVGWPQLENNSLVNSTVASAVTAASGASGVNGSAVYSIGGGTGTAATLNVTWAAGVMTVNSVASAGSYTVFPPSPPALTYVSGAATGWTGATVNLTPTNNAANAFATSPIVTTSSAATRAADVVTMPLTVGSAYTLFGAATPQAPTGYTVNQITLSVNDGTGNNRTQVYRNSGGGSFTDFIASGGVTQPIALAPAVNWTQGLLGNGAGSFSPSVTQLSFNGTLGVAGGALTLPTVTQINFGSRGNSDSQFNGFMSKAAIWQTQAIPNAQLQALQ